MKFNLNKYITDMDGNDIKENDKSVSMKRVIVDALVANFMDEPALSGEEKFKRGALAHKIHTTPAGKSVDLTAEETSLVKNLVGKYSTPLVVHQIYNKIEGHGEEAQPEAAMEKSDEATPANTP